MPKWILFAALPLLAAALVFGPPLLQSAGTEKKPAATSVENEKPKPAAKPSFLDAETPKPSPQSSGLSPMPSAWKVGASLIFVLAIAFGGVWFVRRFRDGIVISSSSTRNIEIKETQRIGKGRALHYIRVSERLLLVGESESGLTLLKDLTTPDVDVMPAPMPAVEVEEEDEDGATPRNLIRGSTPRRREPARAKLNDFRELLGRLG